MKNLKFKYFMLIVVIMVFNSCNDNDFIDANPVKLTVEEAYVTKELQKRWFMPRIAL